MTSETESALADPIRPVPCIHCAGDVVMDVEEGYICSECGNGQSSAWLRVDGKLLPRPFSNVLVAHDLIGGGRRVCVAHFDDNEMCGGWWYQVGLGMGRTRLNATHWMPMPDPPPFYQDGE